MHVAIHTYSCLLGEPKPLDHFLRKWLRFIPMKLTEASPFRRMRSRAKHENRGLGMFPNKQKTAGGYPLALLAAIDSSGSLEAFTPLPDLLLISKRFTLLAAEYSLCNSETAPTARTEYVPSHHFCFTAGHILMTYFTHNMQTSGTRPRRSARSYQSVI